MNYWLQFRECLAEQQLEQHYLDKWKFWLNKGHEGGIPIEWWPKWESKPDIHEVYLVALGTEIANGGKDLGRFVATAERVLQLARRYQSRSNWLTVGSWPQELQQRWPP